MADISFLIGSGFSIPIGLPPTGKINERLQNIKESEIIIHTSQDARFLREGETDPNADHMNPERRRFIEEFLIFYNENILKENEHFHYEDFYDFYSSILRGGDVPDNYSKFLDAFEKRKEKKYSSDFLFNFDLTFNQLIAGLIHKPFERCSLGKPYHPNFKAFLLLLEELKKYNIIHLHSLNHDLYMEYLCQSETLSSNIDDGFEEIGSPFYGNLYSKNERYMVRIPRFIDKFVKRFRYYKLHGSINNYWFKDDESSTLIRLKWGLGNTDVFKEINDKGVLKYNNSPLYFHSDFLSGTTSKIRRYDKGHYYPLMFNYFVENLKNSDHLIIIGYGFGDRKINELIESHFGISDSNKIFVIDINKPNIPLLEQDNVFYIDGGVVEMDINEILSKIN